MQKIIMIDSKIPLFHGCLKLGLLYPIIEHLWELGMTLLWRHWRRPFAAYSEAYVWEVRKGRAFYVSQIFLLWKHSASISPQNGISWNPENNTGIRHDSSSNSREGHAAHMKLNCFDDVTTNLGPILCSAW